MKKLILRILSVIFVTLLLLVIGLYGVMWILVKGPSSAEKQQFVCAVQESSAMGWVANLYLSQAEIDEKFTCFSILLLATVFCVL